MCRSKKSTDVIEPKSKRPNSPTHKASKSFQLSSIDDPSSSSNFTSLNFTNTDSSLKDWSKSSVSSRTSLSSLKESLPENPHIYEFSEICAATNNFLARRFSSSSSSSSWRCFVRGKDVVVFQRKSRRAIHLPELKHRLSVICRSNHNSLVKLLGVSVSGNYIYLVYEYVAGANLADSLRNLRNPSYTVLSTWLSRMQIAADLAHGLDYIHHRSGLNSHFVHNHIKSSSIIVTEDSLNPKICHFGTSELCCEVEMTAEDEEKLYDNKKRQPNRLDSNKLKVEGTRGYMSPEVQSKGVATQKSDTYAFGVVILELLSGEEALRYTIDRKNGGYQKVSVIDTARDAVENGVPGTDFGFGRLRQWMDRRLKDSFPMEVAERTVRLILQCVEDDPNNRPDMGRVSRLLSKWYLESKQWSDNIKPPTEFSFSMAQDDLLLGFCADFCKKKKIN